MMRGQLAEEFLKDSEMEIRSKLFWKIPSNLMLNFLTKPDFVAYNYKHANNFSRRIVHKLYKNVAAAWTIKDQKALDENRGKFDIFIFDSFIPETKEKVEYRKSEGCAVVEMECSALAACAQMRNAIWGELLFTADTLADAEHYDERDWGEDSAEYALQLCIEAVLNL